MYDLLLNYIKNTYHVIINYGKFCRSKFEDVYWNNITYVICSTAYVNKQLYKFLLKLPKLRQLRFRKLNDDLCLITYNVKFFKHKLLLMNTSYLHSDPCEKYKTNIIFIL